MKVNKETATRYKKQLVSLREGLNRFLALPGDKKDYMRAAINVIEENLKGFDEEQFRRLLCTLSYLEDHPFVKCNFMWGGPMRDMAEQLKQKQQWN